MIGAQTDKAADVGPSVSGWQAGRLVNWVRLS
jgi:hypothetical protein